MVKIVSFDLEGTLVTQDFSEFVWLEGIPKLYAKKERLNFQHAKKIVLEEYEKVGENRIEWYDIKYWLNHFGLKNNYMEVFREYVDKISYYPEVFEVLESLSKNYVLVLISNSAREFLEFLTEKI
ncbi:MAG: haloacid dehalogenase, partial [Candidatus Hecatellales archaeon ex4484_218]